MSLHVETTGSGAPVVFVHGTPTTPECFEPLRAALARAFTCHVIHLPGYGRSARPTRPLSFGEIGDLVVEAIAERTSAPVIAIGYSGGFMRLVAVARRLPLRRLVGLGAIAHLEPEERAAFRQFAGALRARVDLRDMIHARMLSPRRRRTHDVAPKSTRG